VAFIINEGNKKEQNEIGTNNKKKQVIEISAREINHGYYNKNKYRNRKQLMQIRIIRIGLV
jgi:hypothetical protein